MGVLVRLVLSVIALVVCLWPLWLYVWIADMLPPIGSWGSLILFASILLTMMFSLWVFILWWIWVPARE